MKRLLAFLLFLATSAFADIHVQNQTGSPIQYFGTPWLTMNQVYVFNPCGQACVVTLFIRNNNPTNGHNIAVAFWQTSDPTAVDYSSQSTNGTWAQPLNIAASSTICGNSASSIAASSTLTCTFGLYGASQAAIQITGTGSAAGNPDTADIIITQGSGVIVNTAGEVAIVSAVTDGDGLSNANIGYAGCINPGGVAIFGCALKVYDTVFNGTTWDRLRTASLANDPTSSTFTGRNSKGAILTENGSRWTVNSAPGAGVVASASIAAEASVRHVIDKVCFSSGSTAAPVATSLQVNIRDGASGAGTILMSFEVDITATTGQNTAPFCTPSLNLPGTTNTATTAEWSSLLANLKETVTITGYNIN